MVNPEEEKGPLPTAAFTLETLWREIQIMSRKMDDLVVEMRYAAARFVPHNEAVATSSRLRAQEPARIIESDYLNPNRRSDRIYQEGSTSHQIGHPFPPPNMDSDDELEATFAGLSSHNS
ncbi:hypothetical protein Cni_G06574 [Canna indica]|uniref:Uncharacterized protein n=1 Tax=Canna indica TaxID=4628 RepID=A0AAQ3JXG9_9LILI|nr:hypothetical protein Cni_G06574 [Canna indica]